MVTNDLELFNRWLIFRFLYHSDVMDDFSVEVDFLLDAQDDSF